MEKIIISEKFGSTIIVEEENQTYIKLLNATTWKDNIIDIIDKLLSIKTVKNVYIFDIEYSNFWKYTPKEKFEHFAYPNKLFYNILDALGLQYIEASDENDELLTEIQNREDYYDIYFGCYKINKPSNTHTTNIDDFKNFFNSLNAYKKYVSNEPNEFDASMGFDEIFDKYRIKKSNKDLTSIFIYQSTFNSTNFNYKKYIEICNLFGKINVDSLGFDILTYINSI